ncbi:MAG: 4'-phosphopantetheinyl transferase superfamily protein [Gammaproteobacteria bacterium]|nr:4'-phosphopantetheinyl transferase superfamily protein [Gammaproteobacteria bacterium]
MSIDHEPVSHWLRLWFSRVGEASLSVENGALEWLSPTEFERLQRIRHDGKRREYLLSRVLMRHALSQNFARTADEWQFTEQPDAAPRIDDLPEETYVSLSHSGGYICFGLASCALGIDIEINNPGRDFSTNAEVFMNNGEREYLLRGATADQDYFYRNWCAKEACYKSLEPSRQARTSLTAINYADLQTNRYDRLLIEGDGGDFRFASVLCAVPLRIEQNSFLEPVTVVLANTK